MGKQRERKQQNNVSETRKNREEAGGTGDTIRTVSRTYK